MIYNFANGNYDAAGAAMQLPLSAAATATLKGVISTTGDQAQAGWKFYPGQPSPNIFYRHYNPALKRVTDFDYPNGYVPWGSIQEISIRAHEPGMMNDKTYDYYWRDHNGVVRNMDWDVSDYSWQNQRWYAGGLMSYGFDHFQARFGYPSPTVPNNFSLRLQDNHGVWSENRVAYYRQDLNAFKPIVVYEQYSDFRVETKY